MSCPEGSLVSRDIQRYYPQPKKREFSGFLLWSKVFSDQKYYKSNLLAAMHGRGAGWQLLELCGRGVGGAGRQGSPKHITTYPRPLLPDRNRLIVPCCRCRK